MVQGAGENKALAGGWKAGGRKVTKTNEIQEWKERHQEESNRCCTTNMMDTRGVLFVDYTPGSRLAKRLRKEEEKIAEVCGYKVKIITKS